MTENIFDLTDISDIPDEISAGLSRDVFDIELGDRIDE